MKWNSGYQLSSGSWSYIEATYVAKSLSITTTSATATATAMGTAASIFNFASAVSLWSMINQMQLFFFLLMTGQYIPKDVETVIVGNKFCLYPFDYFQFKSITFTNYITEYFDFATSDTTLNLAGISSGSSIVNVYSLAITLAIFVVHHIVVSILIKIQTLHWAKFQDKIAFRFIKWITTKLFVYLSFGFYLRLWMETNQYLLMSSISEMHQFNNYNQSRILSFMFSLCLSVIWTTFIIFVCYLALNFKNLKFKKLNMFGELFDGIKDNLKSRLYVVALLLRRAVFVLSLILLSSVSPKSTISFLSGVQWVYCILTILIRPYELTKTNVVEIINEVYFACWFGSLFFLDSEDKWNDGITNTFIGVLISCTFINFLVIMSKQIIHNLVVDLFAKMYVKFRRTKKVSNSSISPSIFNFTLQKLYDL